MQPNNNINYALIENQGLGKILLPSLDCGKAAAANVTDIPNDLRFFISNVAAEKGHPISGFSGRSCIKTRTMLLEMAKV